MAQSVPSTAKDACDRMMAQAANLDAGTPFAVVAQVLEAEPPPATAAEFYKLMEGVLIDHGFDPHEEP